MSLPGALQGRRKSRRIQKQFHKTLLVLDGQANHLGFVDCPMCDLLSGATTKSLILRPCNSAARLTTRSASGAMRASMRAVRIAGWGMAETLLRSIVRDCASQCNLPRARLRGETAADAFSARGKCVCRGFSFSL